MGCSQLPSSYLLLSLRGWQSTARGKGQLHSATPSPSPAPGLPSQCQHRGTHRSHHWTSRRLRPALRSGPGWRGPLPPQTGSDRRLLGSVHSGLPGRALCLAVTVGRGHNCRRGFTECRRNGGCCRGKTDSPGCISESFRWKGSVWPEPTLRLTFKKIYPFTHSLKFVEHLFSARQSGSKNSKDGFPQGFWSPKLQSQDSYLDNLTLGSALWTHALSWHSQMETCKVLAFWY